MISPTQFLLLTLAVTLGAAAASRLFRRRRRRHLRRLAERWGMHYSPGDRFRLAGRIAASFPVCGAADLRVSDLMYGSRDDGHCYIFTANYTEGVIRTKHRRRRVVRLVEPQGSADRAGTADLCFAPADLPWLRQYESLHSPPPPRPG